mgnify:CR=1 FL=1
MSNPFANDSTPVALTVSQLNRQVEQHERLPRLSDIREAGAVEQDADVVLLLPRDPAEAGETGSTFEATVIVAKHRNGKVGNVKLLFQGDYVRFVNPSYQYSQL